MRTFISSGSRYEAEVGYSRAVVDDMYVHVSGTTGFDYATMRISDDVVAQTDQSFRTIAATLGEAGSSLDAVVRVRYILPTSADFEKCWPTIRFYLGQARPAATMISAGLLDPRMKIEIEVTALRLGGS